MTLRFLILIFFCLEGNLFANNKQLQFFLDQVFSHSEDFKKSEESVKKSSSDKTLSQSEFLPDIEASYTYFTEDEPGKLVEDPQKTTKLSLKQNLFNGFKSYNMVRGASLQNKIAESELLLKKITLAEESLDKFFQFISTKKEMEHLEQQVEILRGRSSEQNQRSKIGKSRSAEFYSSAAELKLKESELQELKFKLKTFESILISYTGSIPPTNNLNFSVRLEEKSTFSEKLLRRPDLEIERSKKLLSEREVNQAEADFLPSLNLLGNYYFDRPSSKDDSKWDATLSLTLPIFNGFETYAKRSSKKQELIMNSYQEKVLEEKLNIQLEERYNTLVQLQESVKFLEESLNFSKKSYELTKQDYAYGRVNNLEVLQSLRTYIDTARSYDRSLTNFYANYYKLNVFVGDFP